MDAALRAETALALYAERRLTYAEIAAELGVSRQRVHQIIKEALADAAERRHQLADFALERELLGLDAALRQAAEILQRPCGECGGDEKRRVDCWACKQTGFFYKVNVRLSALGRLGQVQQRRIKLLGIESKAPTQPATYPEGDLYSELVKLSVEELDELLAAFEDPEAPEQDTRTPLADEIPAAQCGSPGY